MDERPEERGEPKVAPPSHETPARGAPVDVHPPRTAAHSVKNFLIELLTITAGVLIALSIEGLREWNNHRQLVKETHETIAREIADNKGAIERHLAGAEEREKDVDTSMQLANELLKTKTSSIRSLSLGFHMSSLSAAAWQGAERTGALTHMDYADVQKYAKLYGTQSLYDDQQRRLMAQTVAALSALAGGYDSDPHKAPPEDLERFRQNLMALRGLLLVDRQLGGSLLKIYSEALAK